jgi:hypothetical protein
VIPATCAGHRATGHLSSWRSVGPGPTSEARGGQAWGPSPAQWSPRSDACLRSSGDRASAAWRTPDSWSGKGTARRPSAVTVILARSRVPNMRSDTDEFPSSWLRAEGGRPPTLRPSRLRCRFPRGPFRGGRGIALGGYGSKRLRIEGPCPYVAGRQMGATLRFTRGSGHRSRQLQSRPLRDRRTMNLERRAATLIYPARPASSNSCTA